MKKIGLFLCQMEGGSEIPIWKAVITTSEALGWEIIVFPGRSIDSPYQNEARHNIIYQFLKSENLDGLIINSGTLGNYLGINQMFDLLKNQVKVPMISLFMKIPGVPSIVVHGKTAIRAAMKHFYQNHHAENIFFVKGPENNPVAEERFEGYMEGLAEINSNYNSSFVFQGDFTGNDSEVIASQVKEKLDGHKTAILFSNDEMAVGVTRALIRDGVKIPEDLMVCGFDNIEDTALMKPQLTTIGQPLYKIGEEAVNLLKLILDRQEFPLELALPCQLIKRESCGCGNDFDGKRMNQEKRRHWKSPGMILHNYSSYYPKSGKAETVLATIIIHAIDPDKYQSSKKLRTMDLMERGLKKAQYPEYWQNLLNQLKYMEELTPEQYSLIERLEWLAQREMWRKESEKRIQNQAKLWNLQLLNNELNRIVTIENLEGALSNALPVFGIQRFAVAFYPQNQSSGEQSHSFIDMLELVAVWATGSKQHQLPEKKIYPSLGVLTNSLWNIFLEKSVVVLPLFKADHQFGLLILDINLEEEIIYEIIREQLSQFLAESHFFGNPFNKKTESELKHYQELPSLIIETDSTGIIFDMNLEAQNYLGLSIDENQTHPLLQDLVDQEHRERFWNYMNGILENKKPILIDIRFVQSTGRKFSLILKAVQIQLKNRAPGIRWNGFPIEKTIQFNTLPVNRFIRYYQLSERESEVFYLLLQGLKRKEIGQKLFISESTVKNHIKSIYVKTGVQTKEELVLKLEENHIASLGYEHYLASILQSKNSDQR